MAQTMVTEFFHARKRTFDSGIVKKVNAETSKGKLKKTLLSIDEVIPIKIAKTLETIKSTIIVQGLPPKESPEKECQEFIFDKAGSLLETPKSSQSLRSHKTPKRRGNKRRPATSVQRVPKRRKLCLTETIPEPNSIKHFFNVVEDKPSENFTLPIAVVDSEIKLAHAKTITEPSAVTIKETSEQGNIVKKEEKVLESEPVITNVVRQTSDQVEMVKAMVSQINKPLSPLPITPTKVTNVEVTSIKLVKGTNLESKINQKPSFDDLKAKLKSCGKLKDLKDCLAKINESSTKLRDINIQKNSLLQKSPVQSPIKLRSPSKSPSKAALHALSKELEKMPLPSTKAPAYERFHNLASTQLTSQLALPYKYKTLAEFFRCLDTVVCMLHNRREICTFDKVKVSVQQMIKRLFDKTKLAQITTVFPSAYFYSLENVSKIISKKDSAHKSLIVTPNFNFDEQMEKAAVKKVMDPTSLTRRRAIFNKRLVEITKQHHKDFLSSLTPPIVVQNDSIVRWHPKFPIEEIPDIEVAFLPEETQDKVNSAKDVLQKMKGRLCSRVEKALESVHEKYDVPQIESPTKPEIQVSSKVLKGISQSLIDKIRAKESATIMREMLRHPESEKRIAMLGRLPDFASMLRSYFIQEKKAAIPIEVAVAKLFESYRSTISQPEVEEHIKLLAKVLPDWLSVIQIRKGIFLKIDKTKDLNILNERIKDVIKKEKGT